MGGGGVKNYEKLRDVIYGRPLIDHCTTGWVEMPSLPSTLAYHCMAYRDEESVMVVGGIENSFCCSDSTYILDTESQVSIL
jgi:hypothetical protein